MIIVRSRHVITLVVRDQPIKDPRLVVAGLLDGLEQERPFVKEAMAVSKLIKKEVPIGLRVVVGKARRYADERHDRFG